MSVRQSFSFFFLLLSFAFPICCQAKACYVSGYREITLRTGPSLEHRIVALLETGHEVDLVGEEGDFYRVSLVDGRQGYVLKTYMTEQIPAEQRLRVLEEETQRQAQELTQLQQENTRLKAAKARAEKEAAGQVRLVQELQKERAEVLRDKRLYWFLAGAGVLLIGWLLGWTRVRLWRRARRLGLKV